MDIFQLVFENDKVIVECDTERHQDGRVEFSNILVTDKTTGKSYETIELPDNLTACANIVAAATPDDE